MVDISIVNGIINQLITGGAPPCSTQKNMGKSILEKDNFNVDRGATRSCPTR
jgi:hypothetical protein